VSAPVLAGYQSVDRGAEALSQIITAAIGRTIVDDDQFDWLMVLGACTLNRLPDKGTVIVGGYDDRNRW